MRNFSLRKTRLPPFVVALVISLITVGAIFAIRTWSDPLLRAFGALHPFLIAVLISAWFSGPLAGALATVLGFLLGEYFFSEPRFSFEIKGATSFLLTITYFVLAILTILVTWKLRIHRERAELGIKRVLGLLEKEKIANQRLQEASTEITEANTRIIDILESINDAFMSFDREWRFTYVNQRGEEFSRLPKEELLGRSLWDVFPFLKGTEVEENYRKAMFDHVATRFEFPGLTPERWFELGAFPSKEGLSVYATDISKRKQAEAENQRSQQNLRDFLENGTIGMHWVGPDGKILWANRAELEMLGYSRDEYISTDIASYYVDQDTISDIMTSLMNGEVIRNHEAKLRCRDGSIRDVMIDSSGLWENGKFIHTRCFTRDITDIKRAREREKLLDEATTILSSSLDYESTLRTLASTVVPKMADWCTVDILDEDGCIRRLAAEHIDSEKKEWARKVNEQYPPDAKRDSGIPLVIRTGQSQLVSEVTDEMLQTAAKSDDHLQLLRQSNLRSAMIVPLATTGKSFGAISFYVTDSPKRFNENDLEYAKEFARRAAMAIENAKLYHDAQQAIKRYEEELKERIRVETELRNNEKIHRAIGESIDYGIWICDASGHNIYASESFLELVGLTQEECSEFGWSRVLHPDDAERTLEAWKECVSRCGLWDIEHRFRGVDGKWHPILARGVPIRTENGAPLYWAGINLDISRQKQTEAELRAAKEAADAANAAKTAFLANMSHEIRTPLGAIMGFSDLLVSDDPDPCERQDYVDIIQRNGQLLTSIIDDILDLSKVEAGKLAVEKSVTSLQRLLNDIKNGLSLQAANKGIDLSFEVNGSIPAIIETDSIRLKQVLNNIIGNAIKFTARGGVRVLIENIRKDDGRDLLYFEVRDTGPGIDAQYTQNLFEPFNQADPSFTRKHGGTGLGLALSRRLARLLGGEVVLVSSTPGEGSVFGIYIDPGDEAQISMSARAFDVQPSTTRGIKSADLAGLKVLVVDDAKDNLNLVDRVLSRAGALVTTAQNGMKGVDIGLRDDFDVILMDVQMPIMDGFEAMKKLRYNGFTKPIIALTAHAIKEERDRCLDAGFDEYASKPIAIHTLIEILARQSERFHAEPKNIGRD